MGFFVRTLASSSKGNATLVFTQKTKLLVDVGISYSRVKQSLSDMNLSIDHIDAILLTHAHSDHTKGLPTFLNKTNIPVICGEETFRVISRKKGFEALAGMPERVSFYGAKPFTVDDIHVTAFRFPHSGWLMNGNDHAGDHHCFKFAYNKDGQTFTLGFATDLGHFPEELFGSYSNCDFYVLEANHDEQWQQMSMRPLGLIKRNLSKFGHLSNVQAVDTLTRLLSSEALTRRTKHVLLAHLSRDCNSHELALETVRAGLAVKGFDAVSVSAAPYDLPSDIFSVTGLSW